MIDNDRITALLQSEDIIAAEIVTYHKADDGVTKRTVKIEYYENDYQWSTTTWPLVKKSKASEV